MRRHQWLWLIPVAFLLASCGPAAGRGLILSWVQKEDEPGAFEERLLILDSTGKEIQRIRLPSEPVFPGPFSTRFGNRALVRTADDGWVLIDTAGGRAEELDIPPEVAANLIPNTGGFALSGGTRFMILSRPQGDAVYLVDLVDGAVTDLLGIDDEMRFSFSGQLSPDEAYLVLFAADGLWLVPTDDPDDAERLGDGQTTGSFSFSSDGKQIAYIQRDARKFQVVVEQVDGKDSDVVEDGDWIEAACFVPGQQQLLLVREEEVSLLSLRDGREQELLEFEGRAVTRPWFSPSGRRVLFGHAGDENLWHLLDLKEGTQQELGRLDGYSPTFVSPEHRWLFFRDSPAIAADISFAALDLETGDVQRIRGLDDETTIVSVTSHSADGERALLMGQTDEGSQAWLLDAREGEARLLVSGLLTGGSLSADGSLFVFSSREDREDIESELMLLQMAKGEVRSLGAGIRPVWVRP